MTPTKKLTRRDVAPILAATFPEYKGRRFKLEIREVYSITSSQLCWDEGNKTDVRIVRQGAAGLDVATLSERFPWSGKEYRGMLPDNMMVVELHHFGRDQVVYFIVSPGSSFLPKLLDEQPAAKSAALAA